MTYHFERRPCPLRTLGSSAMQRRHDIGLTLLGAVMGVFVFGIDTFTSIESAIAVLYVVALLTAADALSRTGIMMAAGVCLSLCVLSYLVQHGVSDDLQTILRLLVSLSAIAITAALLLRNDAARSELLRSHEELARGEYRYRSIFEEARVAIWEQDYSRLYDYLQSLRHEGVTDITAYAGASPDFVRQCAGMVETVAVNHAAVELLHARSEAELLGSLSKFIPSEDHRFLEVIAALYEGRKQFEAQGTIQAMDGAVKSVMTVLRYPEDRGALDRVIVCLVDITEQEQTHAALLAAQMELARANRVSTVGVVSASIAHELHQPLGALTVNAETCLRWLDREPPNLEAARKAVERMVSDAERASAIVKNTRSLVSRHPASMEIIDATALVRETATLLDHQLRTEGVSLRVTGGDNAMMVAMARNELQQVIINLVTNAAQAMSHAGSPRRSVTISMKRPTPAMLRIDVADTGPGVDETCVNKLFDPFFTTKPDGMGMGLAISRSAVEARGGRLTVANNHPEPGSCFTVELPQADGPPTALAAGTRTQPHRDKRTAGHA